MLLKDLSASEKLVLRLLGDKPGEKILGLRSTIPNYLVSIGLAEYCGGGCYCLTAEGRELYQERILFLNKEEVSVDETTVINNLNKVQNV